MRAVRFIIRLREVPLVVAGRAALLVGPGKIASFPSAGPAHAFPRKGVAVYKSLMRRPPAGRARAVASRSRDVRVEAGIAGERPPAPIA